MFYELGIFGTVTFAVWMSLAYRIGKRSSEAIKIKNSSFAIQALLFAIIGSSKLCTKIGSVTDIVVSIALMKMEGMKETAAHEPRVSAAKVETLAASVKRGRIAAAL